MLTAVAILFGSAAVASVPGTELGLPNEVRRFLDEKSNWCRRGGGIPLPSPGLIRAIDLTSDGRLDYLIDMGRYQCTNAVSIFSSGHDGAPVSIFVGGSRKTAKLSYDGTSHSGLKIVTRNGRARVHLVVGAQACGQPKSPDRPFSDWWFCTRPLDWDAGKDKFILAPLSQAKRIH